MSSDEDEDLTDEELTAELLTCGVTPEMIKESVSKLKAELGLPDYCGDMRCGVAGRCSCPGPTPSAKTAAGADEGKD